MALSSFFNRQTPPSFISEDPHVYSDASSAINESFVDPCYDFSSFSYSAEDFPNLLPGFSPSNSDPFLHLMSSPPEDDQFNSLYPSQKRRKCFNDCCRYSDYAPTYPDGFPPSAWPMPKLGVEMLTPLPEFDPPKLHFNESNFNDTGERVVSAQSIAARERRRKITDKTQELGRLIPGGNKMNTADMLQAAFKYVKFMQAQLGLLQIMEPSEKNYELHELLMSPCVEEKLYMEKCLVPTGFAGKITDDHDGELKPAIYEDLPFLPTSIP